MRIGLFVAFVLSLPTFGASADNLSFAASADYLKDPGGTVSYEHELLRSGFLSVYGQAGAGAIVRPDNYLFLFAGPAIGARLSAPIGLYFDASLAAGYIHTLPIKFMVLAHEDGTVSEMPSTGVSGGMARFDLGFGWAFGDTGISAAFLKAVILAHYPWHYFVQFRPALEAGMRWSW